MGMVSARLVLGDVQGELVERLRLLTPSALSQEVSCLTEHTRISLTEAALD